MCSKEHTKIKVPNRLDYLKLIFCSSISSKLKHLRSRMPKIDEENLVFDVTLTNLHLTTSLPVTNLCKCSLAGTASQERVYFQQINTVIVPAFQYILSGSALAQTECSEQHEIDSAHALLTSKIRKKPRESSEFRSLRKAQQERCLKKVPTKQEQCCNTNIKCSTLI